MLVAAQEIHGQRAAAVRRATSPHGDVRLVRGFKAQRDPCVCKVRRTERPERQRALDVAADCLVIIERFLDEREVLLGNFRQMTALVDALHQRIAHIKYGFLASAALHRVAPNGALLRRQTRGRVRRNGRIAQVVFLVARRLNTVAREHRVVDAHAARGTVFNHKVGVAGKDGIEPSKICALVPE